MPWRPLSRIAFAIAIYPFQPLSPADLPLELGDELYIIEEGGQDGSWYRGYLVAPPSLLAGLTSIKGRTLEARVFSGIFPRSCVEIREVLGDASVNGSAPEGNQLICHHADTNGDANSSPPPAKQNGVLESRSMNGSIKRRMSHTNGSKGQDMATMRRTSLPFIENKPDKTEGSTWGQDSLDQFTTPQKAEGTTLPLTPVSMSPGDTQGPRPPAPVPMLKVGDETPTSALEPLVDEIASCLREWHSTNLHELLLSRRYTVLEKLSGLVLQVDSARRQLLHEVLTGQELNLLREKTVWDLVRGNKMLSNEIIVRDPKQRGRLLMGDDSAVEISKLQSMMSLLDNPPLPAQDEISLHHILVEFKGFTSRSTETLSLVFYLCMKSPGEPPKSVTESFAIDVPQGDQSSKAVNAGKFRTLFTDLTPKDIGKTLGSDSQLYLVIKVQLNQLAHSAAPLPLKSTARENISPQKSTVSNSPNSTPRTGGRRSLMWAQSKFNSSRHRNQQALSAIQQASDSTVVLEPDNRPHTPSVSRPSTHQGPQLVGKNIGVSVLPLRDFRGKENEFDQDLVVWSPSEGNSEKEEAEDRYDALIPHLISSHTGRYRKSKFVEGVQVHLHSFINSDAESLIKQTPTLLHNICETPKIRFSRVPTKARSDIYLTLTEAFIPDHALFSHPDRGSTQLATSLNMQNVQLTLEVRKATGERIERCIFPSSNSTGHTAWRTTAAMRGEAWNQSIKLVIPNEDVPHAHLIMSVADAPGFPFALSWMPLFDQEAFIRDGIHTPLLYVYDKTTSNTEMGKSAYLSFPWRSNANNEISKVEPLTGRVARLRLESYLCSTVFSQDQILLGILKWREKPEEQVLSMLKQFLFVPEIEIVKVVNDVFDALFSILVDRSGNDEYESLVFNALVAVLGINHDRRFNLGPLVNEYAEKRFNYPFATPCLTRSYLRLISNHAESQNSRHLRAAFKVGRQILKFIIEARKRQQIKEAGIGIKSRQSSFNHELQSIFKALESLIREPSPSTIGSKTLVVQYIHTWLPELRECFTQEEIIQTVISFIDACVAVTGKLILHKLILILNVSQSIGPLQDNLRQTLDIRISQWIEPYWGSNDEVTEQWREQVRLCCSIVNSQANYVGQYTCAYFMKVVQSYSSIQLADRPDKRSLSFLFPATYPFPMMAIPKETAFDENLIELAALIPGFLDFVTLEEFDLLGPERFDVMSTTLDVSMSILSGEGFPSSWLTLHVFHHKTIFQMIEKMFVIMMARCLPSPDDADDFNTELWRMFFTALLKLVGSEALALETFPEQKRRAVWKIAGDVREQGAVLLRKSWDAIGWETSLEEQRLYGLQRLGGYQVQYVPSLVAPIMELCMSIHEGLRSVAVSILQSMIVSEWGLNDDLSVIQTEMIKCLDVQFKSRDVLETAQQKLFVGELQDLFSGANPLEDGLPDALKSLIATMEELLDLLVAVHCPEATESFRIMHTLQLMEFLKDAHQEDIYIRYVHQLAELQSQSRNPVEAGLALRLHADLYSWDPSHTVPSLSDPHFPEQSAFERKELLYFEIIKYFEEGAAWGCALTCYREIADQYEHALFDFAKLARAQRSMATIYEAVARGDDQSPRYFRVNYRGLGFPMYLRDKCFIFQGNSSERLTAFTDRLQQQHPAAQVVPLGPINDVEGQFLQISTVSPYRDLEHPLYQRSKVPQSTRDYLLSFQPNRFSITSRRHSPKSGVKDQWVEKTVYTTAASFPTILRRSEIVSADIIPLSPLQTAVERTTRKTSELVTLERVAKDGSEAALSNLADAIKTSIGPGSLTSVAQYREMLPNPRGSGSEEEEDPEPETQLLENALKTALLDHATTLRHCISLYSHPAYQSTRYDLTAQFSSTFAPELSLLTPPQPSTALTSQTPSWLPPVHAQSPSLLRAPSNSTPKASRFVVHTHPYSPSQTSEKSTTSPPSTTAPAAPSTPRSRISLSFLKRHQAKPPSTTNGVVSSSTTNHPPSHDEDTPSTHSRKSRNSHVSWRSSEDNNDTQKSRGGWHDGEQRPATATSSASGTAASNTTGKGGGVRKRLSLLGIGKKDSKRSFEGVRVDSVTEE